MKLQVASLRKNKVDKHLSKLTKRQRENIQINKIRNEKRDITSETQNIKEIIGAYFENVYTANLENIKEVNNICVRYHLLKLYEVQNNLYRCIIPKEIEAVIKSLPTNNTRLFEYIILPDIQEVLISIPIKLFYKIEINGILPNYFMRPQLP